MSIIILLYSIWLMVDPPSERVNHALYLSMTEINVDQDPVNITIKVFSDDLRDALKNHAPGEYKPTDPSHFFSTNKTIATDYFNEKLKLFADKSRLKLMLEGHTIAGDAHFITFQSNHNPMKKISADATFFMELFPTQLNVVKINSGKSTHFLKFTQGSGTQSVNL